MKLRPLSVNMNIDTGEKTWLTPPEIIRALGPFDLDPCCPPNMPWRTAERMVCRPDDGLAVDWTGQRVWLNPPYGREAVPFLRKMAEHEGGVYCSYSPEPTPRRGRTGYFHTHTAYCSFEDGCISASQTERPERLLPRRLRSPRIQNWISSDCARAV